MAAINIGFYAQTPYGKFPYVEPLALDSLGTEISMVGKISRLLGIEVEHTRYNIGLLRILWEIASDGITNSNYSASSNASVDKNVINLKSDITEQYWQSTGKSSEWFVFDVGEDQTLAIDTLAFIDTNFTTSAIIKLQGSGAGNSALPADWGLVPYIQIGDSGAIDPDALVNPTDANEKNRIWVSPTLPTKAYRYFKVSISDTTNKDGVLRIGRFVAGKSLIFTTENCLDVIQFKKENYKDEFKINGFTSVSNNRAIKKKMDITFKNLNRIQYVNYKRLMTYVSYCRDTLKALVFIDPSDTYQFTVFSKLRQMPDEVHTYISNDTSNVELTLSYDEAR